MTLLVSAFESMDGQGTLRILTVSSGDRLTVEVEDTGKGIPPDELGTLFEVGFGSHGGRVGLGLGLPAARKIIEDHGGRLTVQSEVGRGSTFTVSLPVRVLNEND